MPMARFLSLLAGLLLGLAASAATRANTPAAKPSALRVREPWVRWLPAGLPAAGYLTLVNPSKTDRVLTGASSPDYASVELHQSFPTGSGEMGMRRIDQLRVPAGGEVRLAPGGFHLMLMRARHAIKPGETVSVVLKFKHGPDLRVSLPVKPAGYRE